jgi:hypothetical protein
VHTPGQPQQQRSIQVVTARTNIAEAPTDIRCHACGYDLRAHPQDSNCPECGASIAESRRIAAIPRRPAWPDSDRRWRRRILAGVWLLALLPLSDALQAFGWADRITVPNVVSPWGTVTLSDTLLCSYLGVYQALIFYIGVMLLFSKEDGRRRGKLDWTRRWGVICTCVVLLLSAVLVFFIAALVLAGISAVFQSIPLRFQPSVTRLFVEVSTRYLRYGAYPKESSEITLIAFSSIAILLACIPLFDALRSSASKWAALLLLAPLVLFSLMHLSQAGWYYRTYSRTALQDIEHHGVYFRPELLVGRVDGFPAGVIADIVPADFVVEAVKWSIVVLIAVWLTMAQIKAWWRQRGNHD